MRIGSSLWFVGLILFSFYTAAQHTQIKVTIHSRVDTNDFEKRKIALLWINYLNSKPDSLYDNPYWNQAEKLKYRDFDFSVPYLYQVPSAKLLYYYRPTILSIEKEGVNYGIRTIFAADELEDDYRKYNPWAIQKVYAVKENNQWRLKNALPIITSTWNRKTIGKITFIYPYQHQFNEELAKKSAQFCDQIIDEFKFPNWQPFHFYITQSGDELGKLLNFDFFAAGYTTGIGFNDKRILLGGIGTEYYPHEFIHLIVPKFNRHWIIEEGFATWKGGQEGKTFTESARILANELEKNEAVQFDDVLNKKWGWQYAAFYTSGAILCKAAYDKGGVELVKKLLEVPSTDEQLKEGLCTLFELERSELNSFWRKEVLKYKSRN